MLVTLLPFEWTRSCQPSPMSQRRALSLASGRATICLALLARRNILRSTSEARTRSFNLSFLGPYPSFNDKCKSWRSRTISRLLSWANMVSSISYYLFFIALSSGITTASNSARKHLRQHRSHSLDDAVLRSQIHDEPVF